MSFKIKVPLFLFLSFVVVSIVFAFTFSGFDQPLKPYKKLDKSGIEQSYSWENSNPLGDSWGNYLCDNNGDGKKEEWCCCLYRGHLGEDWVLSAKTDVDNNDISKAEIGQSVYSIADGIVFKVADWPECPRDKSHGWGGVVLVKHQIPDDIDKKFNLTNTILPDPKETEEAKKAEQKRVQGLEEKGTKVVYSMYGHLKNIQVKEGDTIKKGDKVGEIGEVCYEGSTKKYSPHLHFEIKNQNAIDKEDKIGNIPGIGHGYSGTNAYAPDRYIPSNFIENNKNLIVEEKPITQPPSPPVGLTGGNDSLSFWDKIVFYWNGFVANVKDIFGGSTGEVQVAKPLTQTEVQQQTNNGSASSPSAGNNNNNKTEENSSPPLEPEVWNQKFISYKLDEKDKDNGIYQLTLRFQNTGNTTWTKDDVSLNVVGGYQGTAAKFYHQSWTTKLRPTTLTTTINPGDIATFTFTLQFPKDPNTYYPQFQPVRYIKDINDFSWIGTDKAIFLAEVKQSSSSALTFAGASVAEVINNDNDNNDYDYDNNYDNAQNPSSPPPPNNTPPPTEEPEPTSPPQDDSSEEEKEDTTPLPVPKLLSPIDGFKINEKELNTITFQWEGIPSLTYSLEISTDSNFPEDKTIFITDLIENTNDNIYKHNFLIASLSNSTTYYWRVKGKDQNNNTVYSEIRSFRFPGWQIEIVDEDGSFCSLAYDKNGNPAIAYTDKEGEWGTVWDIEVTLKYAHWNGHSWDIKVVDQKKGISGVSLAFDDMGNPAMSYGSTYPEGVNPTADINYAHFNGTTWEKEVGVAHIGEHRKTSLAFDKSGRPAIAYGKDGLSYTYFNGTTWQSETVDNRGNIYTDRSLAFNPDNPCIAYLGRYDTGGWYIITYLTYACFNGATWEKQCVDPVVGESGWYASLAFDNLGNPSISYTGAVVMDYGYGYGLKYAHFNGTSWAIEIIDSNSGNGWTSLAFDSLGNPAISYYDEKNSYLKYAYFDGTTWQKEVVDSEGDVGYYSSLAFNNEGNPAIAYAMYDLNTGKYHLKFATYK